jgi:hypothetical protein
MRRVSHRGRLGVIWFTFVEHDVELRFVVSKGALAAELYSNWLLCTSRVPPSPARRIPPGYRCKVIRLLAVADPKNRRIQA